MKIIVTSVSNLPAEDCGQERSGGKVSKIFLPMSIIKYLLVIFDNIKKYLLWFVIVSLKINSATLWRTKSSNYYNPFLLISTINN